MLGCKVSEVKPQKENLPTWNHLTCSNPHAPSIPEISSLIIHSGLITLYEAEYSVLWNRPPEFGLIKRLSPHDTVYLAFPNQAIIAGSKRT